jgi:hypothetical protein
VANVVGLFFVDPDVVDVSGSHIPQIDITTPRPRHVVSIENISGVARSARVFSSLPHGMVRIEFLKNGVSQANWDDQVFNIPMGAKRQLGCDLRRNGGPAGVNEPLQTDRVDTTQGTLPPVTLRQGLPIQHLITVL